MKVSGVALETDRKLLKTLGSPTKSLPGKEDRLDRLSMSLPPPDALPPPEPEPEAPPPPASPKVEIFVDSGSGSEAALAVTAHAAALEVSTDAAAAGAVQGHNRHAGEDLDCALRSNTGESKQPRATPARGDGDQRNSQCPGMR